MFGNLCRLYRFYKLYRLYGLYGLYGLYRLYRLDLCPCIFLGRPGLELLQQIFGWLLTDFGLTLDRLLHAGEAISSPFGTSLAVGGKT